MTGIWQLRTDMILTFAVLAGRKCGGISATRSGSGGSALKDIEREGAVVSGHVKWYDAVKGYGFVVPDDSGSDVMVHASCVRAFGRMSLNEGSKITLIAVAGPRGLQAQKLIEVTEAEGHLLQPGFAEGSRPTEFLGPEVEAGPLQPARVKWFDKQKGFGFVNVFGSTEDVFVHMETVRRCGFQDLSSGEGMAVRTFRGPRGLMVAELRLWETAVQD